MNQPETITNFQHIYITVDGEMALIVFSSCEKVGTIWTEDKDMIKAYTKDPKVKVFQHKYTPREKS